MKNKNILWLTAGALLYGILFYQENPGINFLIFTVYLISLCLFRDNRLLGNTCWLTSAAGGLLSSTGILLYGYHLAVLANILSLSMLSIYAISSQASLPAVFIHSVYSIVKAPWQGLQKILRHSQSSRTSIFHYASVSLIPVLIFFVFAWLYRQGNPLFKNLTDTIDLSFIRFSWFAFIASGTALIYAFMHPAIITSLVSLDSTRKDNLHPKSFPVILSDMLMQTRNLSGMVLLLLLNGLLIIVNFTDIHYLFIDNRLPDALGYSDYLHQGIYTIIFSVISAVAVVLYYFKDDLNFYHGNKGLKILAYTWLVQNAVTVLLAMFKNNMYISEYSLTYKRIGVYIYLILTIAGLVLTFVKIARVKSSWFLIRKNAWVFYTILVLSCLINWDLLIVRYNLRYSKNPDYNYLASLGSSSIPDLLLVPPHQLSNSAAGNNVVFTLQQKMRSFIKEDKKRSWPSFSFERKRIRKAIESHP